MREKLHVKKKKELLVLITNIAYADVPGWWGSSRKNLHMNLIVPKERENGQKRPTVVFICGGAFLDVDNAVWLPEMLYFARRGYNAVTIEYRTSNEYSFPAPLCDVKAAIRFLKAHQEEYGINPEQIFIMGESAGGALASLAGLTAQKKEYDTGDFLEYDSSVCGVVDFYGVSKVSMEKTDVNTHPDLPYWINDAYMGIGYTKEMADESSAVCQVTKDAPPFMILHGDADDMVDISNSEELYEALLEKGVDATYLVLEGAGHADPMFYQDEISERIYQFMEKIITNK